jgi:hypothetical protein
MKLSAAEIDRLQLAIDAAGLTREGALDQAAE